MQRFYFEHLEEKDDSITIKNPEVLNQLVKVMRVKPGDEVIFFNGEILKDFVFEIKAVDKREVFLVKTGYKEVDTEIDFNLNIIGALPNKLEKIEYILQKGTEIGVSNFMFFRSDRSQKLNLSENKLTRLNKIIIEAVEQAGRSIVPELVFMDDISLEDFKDSENVLFHTQDDESTSLKELKLDYSKNINLFVGPEGGFSDEEIDIFMKTGFKKVHLGDRILRTETTGVVAGFYIIQNR